jgi:hypothetical protein
MKFKKAIYLLTVGLIFWAGQEVESKEKSDTESLRIWVCGDNTGGFRKNQMKDIRSLYNQLEPAQYVISVGDVSDGNTLPDNMARELRYVSDFIYPFKSIGESTPIYPLPTENKYFSCPGNHDVLVKPPGSEKPGDTYKKWLGLERSYYKKSFPNIDIFFLDTVNMDPTPGEEVKWKVANTSGDRMQKKLLNETTQGKWWQSELKRSKAPWKVTLMHHGPYDSIKGHYKGGHADVRFPYDELGVDLVISGHEHAYERLFDGKTHYIVQGIGGGGMRPLVDLVPNSLYQCAEKIGVCIMIVTKESLTVEWYIDNEEGIPKLDDKVVIKKK